MGKYDDMLDKAEESAEAAIAEKLAGARVDTKALMSVFEGTDEERAKVLGLAKELNHSADRTARRKVLSKFFAGSGAKLGKTVGRLLLKVVTGGLAAFFLLVALAPPSSAGIIDLDPVADWLKANSKRTRAGVSVNLNGQSRGVGYIPLAWDAKRSYWDLGLGFSAAKIDQGRASVGFGLNLVALGHDAIKKVVGVDRVGILPLPPLWIGPVVESPSLDAISARWDYRERVSFVLTYGFLGG